MPYIFIVILFFVFTGCDDEITRTTSSFEKEVCFIYFSTETQGNTMKSIKSYKYLNYGVIEADGQASKNKEYCTYVYSVDHTFNISDSDYDYIKYVVEDIIDADGNKLRTKIIDYDFYLTKETFKTLNGE